MKMWYTLSRWLSLPAWIVISIYRSKLIRAVLLIVGMIVGLLFTLGGVQLILTVFSFILRLAYGFGFVIIQFVGLFWFLAKTKDIESRPGDKGLVNFKDNYFGNEEIVRTVREIVDLQTVERHTLQGMGGEPITGVILEGPPGTGKTLLARCLATDAESGFIGISGTDFQAMFIGIGPMKVMQKFGKARGMARDYGSCILFIDEVDAIGGNRGGVTEDSSVLKAVMGGMAGMGGLGVMSRLLVELDGLREDKLRDKIQNAILRAWGLPPVDNGTVLVIGATNRFTSLDPALIRPGRFDKVIQVPMPDRGSRKKIIVGYLGKVEHEEDVDIDRLVADTSWASPALIKTAIQRDAPRFALREGRLSLTQRDIEDSFQEATLGVQQPISDFDPQQRRQVAYHEAGHAVAMYYLRPETRIAHVSIVKRGRALGYVMPVEETDIYATPLSRFVKDIMVSLAGHVAVKLEFGEYWTGAAGDFEHIRRALLRLYGHGALGNFPIAVTPDTINSKAAQEKVDQLITECTDRVERLLQREWKGVRSLAGELLERSDIPGAEATEIVGRSRAPHSGPNGGER